MPFVIVEMWEGRTVDQKRNLVKAITDAMVEHADCKPDHLHVLMDGKIAFSGGPEIIKELEVKGYDWIREEFGSGVLAS